jgi:AcrR family transcriptional regulator
MGTTGRPRSQAAHEAILKAALRLVGKHGFRAVSVNEIAAEAGVGKMTLYRHWPNKAAVVMDSLLKLIGHETAFPKANSALESLRRQLHLQAAFFRSSRGNLIRSLVSEASRTRSLLRLSATAGSIHGGKGFATTYRRPSRKARYEVTSTLTPLLISYTDRSITDCYSGQELSMNNSSRIPINNFLPDMEHGHLHGYKASNAESQ